jgi:transcriptional regulator with XRE-family HTH domain
MDDSARCTVVNGTAGTGEPLKDFLRERRQRLDPSLRTLGDRPRIPARLGRPVTQEEMAEAVGISRVWYAMLESGATNRTSARVLDRIAAVLMLDPLERANLLHQAMPEVAQIDLRADAQAVLEGFSVVRSATKRLWAATTEIEALEQVAEEIAGIVRDADLVFYVRRLGEGSWEWPYVLDRGLGTRNREAFESVVGGMTPTEIDEFVFYPAVSAPGGIGTPRHFTSDAVRGAYLGTFCDPKLDLGSLVHVRVASRSGLVAGFTVKHRGRHTYSEEQCAIMATLAELTSVALS